ncbi:MAG: DUF3060 domain-containing protein, partial [Flavobacteriales bacterium]|nr:DUF3060 domain-containing protein [Flavobacteriales bacterium]
MLKVFTTSFALLTCSWAVAQCDLAIANNSLVLHANGVLPASNQPVWVCGGLTSAQVSGNDNTIAVEAGTVFNITGAQNTIYLKDGCIAVLNGQANVVYMAPTAQILSGVTGNTINNCASVNYDDTNAPANGCANVGIDEPEAIDLSFYPNPVSNELFLDL